MANLKPMKTVRMAQVICLTNDFMTSSADSARLDRLHVAEFRQNPAARNPHLRGVQLPAAT
jgi:hypothetical protein